MTPRGASAASTTTTTAPSPRSRGSRLPSSSSGVLPRSPGGPREGRGHRPVLAETSFSEPSRMPLLVDLRSGGMSERDPRRGDTAQVDAARRAVIVEVQLLEVAIVSHRCDHASGGIAQGDQPFRTSGFYLPTQPLALRLQSLADDLALRGMHAESRAWNAVRALGEWVVPVLDAICGI